jgi:lipopolysaccharide transport system ATP-binding protein
MRIAIRVQGVSKRYHLGRGRGTASGTLRDALSDAVPALVQRVRGQGQHVGATTPEFWALRDVSFDVAQGERVAIVGRNGAGKSTLLKIVSRITEPTLGWVGTKGRVASLLEVGTGFHPELSGRENVFLNGAILGMSRAEIRSRFDEIVAFAEVERFLDVPVKRYSSGMHVRLAFAVAAHLDPEILIVDEVLAVGDAQFQAKCLGKMKDVSRSGRTILFVSHNMAAVRALCDRAILLVDGRAVADGPAAQVTARYSAFARASVTERRWESPGSAPGNTTTVLHGVAIRGPDGGEAPELAIDRPFRIEVDTEVTVPGSSTGVTAILRDAEGHCVFSTIGNREPAFYGRPMPAGHYRSSCLVPGNLLNDGLHVLSLIVFGQNFTDAIHVEDALAFHLADSPELRNDFFGKWEGAVRPSLEWTTRPIRAPGVGGAPG